MRKILKKLLKKLDVNLLLITNPINIRYISRFSGSFGFIVISTKTINLITDSRYIETAKKKCKSCRVLNIKEPIWEKLFSSNQKIAFESNHIQVERLTNFKRKFKKNKWISSQTLIEEIRRSKKTDEIAKLKKAARIAEASLTKSLGSISKGIRETDLAWTLEKNARELGAEGLSFSPIVAFEKNASVPHHTPSNSKLRKGDTILIDFGVMLDGYCSDMTRTFFFQEVSDKKRKMYELVKKAQALGTEFLRINQKCNQAFNEVMNFFEKENVKPFFIHSLGHGVGLDIHESPSISEKSKETFVENDVVTCEPGLYIEGKFGIRIEDTGVVTKNGFVSFYKFTKNLTIIE